MAKIGLPKGSGKRLKVREKSVKSQGILKWILSGNPEKVRTIFILQEVMLHIKLKAKNCRTYLQVCLMHLLGWIKRLGIEIVQISVF